MSWSHFGHIFWLYLLYCSVPSAVIISLSSHIRVWSVVRACACAWSSQCQSLACGHSPLSVNLPLPRHNQSNQAMATVIFVDLFNSFCIFLCIFFSVYLFLFISLCIFCNQSSLAMPTVIFVDEFLDHFGRHTIMVGTELTSGSFYGNVSGVIVPIHQSISSASLVLMAGHFWPSIPLCHKTWQGKECLEN